MAGEAEEGLSAAEGLPRARQAVSIARGLADTHPAYAKLLAFSLVLLGRLLAIDPKTQEEALGVSAEAVALCEQLVEVEAVSHDPVLAWALPHHGLRLAEAGYEEALRATAQAVGLSRRLAAGHRATHEDHLAFSLYAHARTRLLADVELEAARDSIREALPIWQAIAEREPGLVAPYLGMVTATHSRLVGHQA
ncbi:hypothetical protein [Streptomyces sp. NPDC055287]